MTDDGVMAPPSDESDDMEDMVKLAAELFVIVPLRDIERPPIDMRASARSKTPPLKAEAKEALCGVEGTVAWTAGPNAAL